MIAFRSDPEGFFFLSGTVYCFSIVKMIRAYAAWILVFSVLRDAVYQC